jgi:DNA polymerase
LTAQEKSLIYNLLNKSDCLFSGKILSDFEQIDFKDDVEFSNAEQIKSQANTENGTNNPAIALSIAQCTSCVLCKTRINTVPGIGVASPLVLVIGEGPGADEDKTGEPFVGKAGQLLDKMLAAIQLSRKDNCFITNIVKCRPPANRTPLPEEVQACAHFLKAQIDILKPKMILALGNTALHNLLNTNAGIKKLHGKFFNYQNIPLLATFHPSALLRDESLKRPSWEDLKIFRNRLLEIVPNYQSSYLNGGST